MYIFLGAPMDKILKIAETEYLINIYHDSPLIGRIPKEIEEMYNVNINQIRDEDGNFLSLKGAKGLLLREGYRLKVSGNNSEINEFIEDLTSEKLKKE